MRPDSLVLIGLAAVVLAAALLRFWAIGRQGFWYDEAVTGWLLRGSPGQLLAAIPRTESTPPLYYLIAWGWVRVFGDTEAGLRSLSAVCGAAAVPVAFAAARELVGRRAGLAAAVLIAVNPLLVWYSQEARAYSLLVLTSGVAFWMFARARTDPTPRRLAAWGIAGAAALCTHYFAVFLLMPEALWLLADRRAGLRPRLLAVAIVGGTGLALASMALSQRFHATSWLATMPLRARVGQVPRQLAVGFTPPAGGMELLVVGAALLAAVVLLAVRVRGRDLRSAGLAASVAAAAILVPVALAYAGTDYLNTRNLIGVLVPLSIALAVGLSARRAGPVGLGALAALAVASVYLVAAVQGDPGSQRAEWQRVSALLARTPGRHAILLDGSSSWARTIGFYSPRTWWVPPGGALVSEVDLVRRLPNHHPCDPHNWWGASCDIAARHQRRRSPVAGFHRVSSQRIAGFAVERFVSPRPVRLYVRKPFVTAQASSQKRKLMLTPTRAPALP